MLGTSLKTHCIKSNMSIFVCSMSRESAVVYADGACSGNGQSGARGGYAVFNPGKNSDYVNYLLENTFLLLAS